MHAVPLLAQSPGDVTEAGYQSLLMHIKYFMLYHRTGSESVKIGSKPFKGQLANLNWKVLPL